MARITIKTQGTGKRISEYSPSYEATYYTVRKNGKDVKDFKTKAKALAFAKAYRMKH